MYNTFIVVQTTVWSKATGWQKTLWVLTCGSSCSSRAELFAPCGATVENREDVSQPRRGSNMHKEEVIKTKGDALAEQRREQVQTTECEQF